VKKKSLPLKHKLSLVTILAILIASIVLVVFVLGIMLFTIFAIPTKNLAPKQTALSLTYEQSIKTITEDMVKDTQDVSLRKGCETKLLLQKEKTRKAITLLHGFTNCPIQYDILAQELFNKGYAVYIPRFPRHGINERVNESIGKLTGEELANFTQHVATTSLALADETTVMGLSGGGILTGYLAQYFPFNHAILLAPNLTMKSDKLKLPPQYYAQTQLLHIFPNKFLWWDDVKKDALVPLNAYPGFNTHALYAFYQISELIHNTSQTTPPITRNITLVTNIHDPVVDIDAVKT
jgi:esterase/lipase